MTVESNHSENASQNEVVLGIKDLWIEYGMRTIFEGLDFSLKAGEKLALAGPNGAGKTTLIKSILGNSTPDRGEIYRKRDIRISYVPQSSEDIKLDKDTSIEKYVMQTSGLFEIQAELQDIYTHLENNPSDQDKLKRLGELQTIFENSGGYQIMTNSRKVLAGMGLPDIDLSRKFSTLSGGEKMKVFIGVALVTEPDILILDEPTNNIDKPALDWLGNFLATFNKSVLVVSHDPDFLDRFVERVVEIVPEKAQTIEYTGNYSTFLQKKVQVDTLRIRELEKLQEEYEEAERVGNKLKAGSQAGVGKGRLAKAAKLEDKIQEKSGNMGGKRKEMNLDFSVKSLGPKLVMMVSNIVVDLNGKQIDLSHLNIEIERGQRWEIKGETGTGKSVLLEVLTRNLKSDDSNVLINEGVSIGYFSQKHEDLDPGNNLIDEVRSANHTLSNERVRSVLGHFLFTGDEQLKKVGVLSQGERSRLALAKLVVGNHNLLIIDEPTSHLDIAARERLVDALKHYNGTLIIVSNDADFLSQVGMTNRLALPDCKANSI